MKLPRPRGSLTAWSLFALVAGLLLGALANVTDASALSALAAFLRPLASLWIAALRMLVLPLVIAFLLAAMVSGRGSASVGRLTARALLLFVVMLTAAAALAIAFGAPLIRLLPVDPETVAALRAATSASVATSPAAPAAGASVGDWIAGLLPNNLFQAAADGALLPVLLFTVLLGLAIARLPAEQRDFLTHGIQGLAAAMLTIVRWVLWPAPFGVFALVFLFTREAGAQMIGLLGSYVVILCAITAAITLLLYPASVLLGRVSLRAFARGAAPGQLVAVSTRSSLASLPALVQGGRDHLRLPAPATGLVLPLSASMLKLSSVITGPVNLLFLNHVFGYPLDGATMVTFVITVLLLSFTVPGLPGTGPVQSLPAYFAAGVPIEAIIILDAVDMVPDIFKTVLNSTAYLSAATILSRSSRSERGLVAEPEPAPAPAV